MTNVQKLNKIGWLGDVRQRLGANNSTDESYDEDINEMDNSELIEKWCGWNLGDESWWTTMKNRFDRLEELDKKD